MKRIGVLTSGGDAPGMNAAIRAVTRRAIYHDMEVIGIRRGYLGLIENDMRELGRADVGGIMQHGGTILLSSRCEEFKTDDGLNAGLANLKARGIEGLVVIGGNGSLQGALALTEQGVPTIGIPASIDNDLAGTDIAIGVDTALNTVLEAIDKIKNTAVSHERAFVIEVMGRESGYIALMSGLAGGVEAIIIPEVEYDLEEMAEQLEVGYKRGKSHCIVLVAEGAASAYTVGRHLRHRTGFEIRITVLGHIQRGGSPTAFDRLLGSRLGATAADLLDAGDQGKMVGLVANKLKVSALSEVLRKRRQIDLKLYELATVLSM